MNLIKTLNFKSTNLNKDKKLTKIEEEERRATTWAVRAVAGGCDVSISDLGQLRLAAGGWRSSWWLVWLCEGERWRKEKKARRLWKNEKKVRMGRRESN